MKKNFSVPVQKGPIRCAEPPTSKMMTYKEKVDQKVVHNASMRDAQTLKFHTPKQ